MPAFALHLTVHPSLPRPRRTSFGGDNVAAMWVPLHVADAPDGLHLRAAGPKLIEVLKLALLQKVLVATVARELVSHKSAEGAGMAKDKVNNNSIFFFYLHCQKLHCVSWADLLQLRQTNRTNCNYTSLC